MLVRLGLSCRAGRELGGRRRGVGDWGVHLPYLVHCAIHSHSISQHFFGWWTMHKARKGPLGFHIQFQEGGAHRVLCGVLC